MTPRYQKILNGIIQTKRITSAYLFSEGDNAAKLGAAKYFARAINCSNENKPCEKCESCLKALKNAHPDIIAVEKNQTSIKIDQIRGLKEIAKYGPAYGGWQCIIINEADTLTTEAANSFLKILEEPAPNVVFILICEREGLLPKTILSRCQRIIFDEPAPPPPGKEALELFSKINKEPFDYIEASKLLNNAKDARQVLKEFFTLYAGAKKIKQAQAVLEVLKGIEKRANAKLAVDVLCLKLWTKN